MEKLSAKVIAGEALRIVKLWEGREAEKERNFYCKNLETMPRMEYQWGVAFFLPERVLGLTLDQFAEKYLLEAALRLRRQVQPPIGLKREGLELPKGVVDVGACEWRGLVVRVVLDWWPAELAEMEYPPDDWLKVDKWYNISADRQELRVLGLLCRLDLCFRTDERLVVSAFRGRQE